MRAGSHFRRLEEESVASLENVRKSLMLWGIALRLRYTKLILLSHLYALALRVQVISASVLWSKLETLEKKTIAKRPPLQLFLTRATERQQ